MSVVRQTLERLKGIRHIEWAVAAAAAAALALLLTHGEADVRSEATALEQRMESVLSCVEGAGRVRVLVNGSGSSSVLSDGRTQVLGVVVVAEGAREIRVRMELEQAVMALLGVDASQIEILGMKGENAS